jgi:[ribosomal protein S5]-alanine N-acetyltransferase
LYTIKTKNLDIIAASAELLDAELNSSSNLGYLLNTIVPEDWPPGEYDRSAVEFFRSCLTENPDSLGWYTWYAILRESQGYPSVLVAAGGFFGPPGENKTVEIGYSVVSGYRLKGYAKEIVTALVTYAFSNSDADCIIARTGEENTASISVLERCGFFFDGSTEEPGIVRYKFNRTINDRK